MDKEEIHTVVNAIQLHDRSEKSSENWVLLFGTHIAVAFQLENFSWAHKELRTLLLIFSFLPF
jgi:hypothetical protein